ncbi:MAG: glycerophosphodiester phosphodiesterase [Eubacteriaceae bacterium]|nr:glycerophosphodiester phosphodiesterase [Eubacteriaceae bacterium]
MKLIRNILATAGIAAGAYLFLVSPDPSRRHVMITDRLAHRGLHDEVIPENSLAAFRAAKQNGLGVELDVQYTLDRKVVVFHDEDLLRMCGVDRKVRDMTYEELSELRLRGTDEKIPLFSEVLEVMSPLPVLCELKYYLGASDTQMCADVLELLRGYDGSMYIESFSPAIVEWFRKNAPDVYRGQLAMNDLKGYRGQDLVTRMLLKSLVINYMGRPHFISFRYTDDSLGLKVCRLFGIHTFGWAPKGAAEVKDALSRFDTVIFEKGGDRLEEVFPEDTV